MGMLFRSGECGRIELLPASCDVTGMKHGMIAFSLALALSGCSQGGTDPAAAPSQRETASVAVVPVPEGDAVPAQASEAAPQSTDSSVPISADAANLAVLGPKGLGDIVVGKAPPTTLSAEKTPMSDTCRIWDDKQRRIYAMTDGKVVTRVTAMSRSSVKTAKGIGVGATEAAVRKAYPDIREQPHKYVEAPAKYLDLRPGGGKTGLRFEIDGEGKVSAIHAGREPEIEYVEGCS